MQTIVTVADRFRDLWRRFGPLRISRSVIFRLKRAVRQGDRALAQKLLALGADRIAADDNGDNALIHGLHCGAPGMWAFLIEQGVDENAPNRSGETPREIARSV